jgi:flavodoxin
MTPRTLVVYYSRCGKAASIGREIARRCAGEVDEILDDADISAWSMRWRALINRGSPIKRPARHPGRYDLVIIGVPVGRTGIPPAVRTYVKEYAPHFKRVAFFCAEGGDSDEHAFAELSRLCGKPPIATYAVERKHLPVAAHREGVSDFMDALHLEPVEPTRL